ncbi:MAG: leucyl aminopeptidase [Gammaproteobacteria bacterium]
MKYRIVSAAPAATKTQCLVVGIHEARQLGAAAEEVNQASAGVLQRLLRKGDLDGKVGASQFFYELPGVAAQRVLVIGLGPAKSFDAATYAKAAEAAAAKLQDSPVTEAVFCVPESFADKTAVYAALRGLVLAVEQATYRFDECKPSAERPRRPLARIGIQLPDKRQQSPAGKALEHAAAMAEGRRLAKDLANLPGNVCTPAYLAQQAREIGRRSRKLKVSVLEEKDMHKLGMGALLSVSRGSREPAKLIVMEYRGGKPGSKPVALVGKGLTFDAGGISIKPAAEMDEMKYDMCGGASVLGAMAACVTMQLPLNVVGVVPSSENLPDGAANKPGDIVTSMSGQTIEVLNTDAEGRLIQGRLILCDALTYTGRFEPDVVIDVATLTGACIIALGHQASGLMANDQGLAEQLLEAGSQVGDRAWQLPLWDEYQEQLQSNFADLANIGGRPAGSITAACFLSRFAKEYKWAHLDIAGVAWKSGKEKPPS